MGNWTRYEGAEQGTGGKTWRLLQYIFAAAASLISHLDFNSRRYLYSAGDMVVSLLTGKGVRC